jgi:quinohemoprotein ethanol dehydrogenase
MTRALLLAGCLALAPLPARADAPLAGRVDAARIGAADREPGQWLAHGRTYDEQRYSPLARIHAGNVGALGLAWSYATGTKRGLEATPIVVDGVMYATGSWSVVFALDAASGRELWRYDPQVPRAKGRNACCDVVNRGVAVWKGRVYVGTIDGRLVALDAARGERVWEVHTVDPSRPYTITGAPRVVKDRVIIGNGGGELGVRGYFSAYDAATGALLWRFYTVPGDPSRPYEHEELAAAAATWSKDTLWEVGLGGTVWDSMAYDPELDLLYVGTGNSTPYNRELRSPGGGDNLFLASILAVRPDTGRLVWHYQTTPGEYWDYTATQHIVLAELAIDGRARKVLMQAPKNGFFYVLDRATGELLSADAYVPVSWATHVDAKTGRPVERRQAHWAKRPRMVSPAPQGGHNWHPMAFSPRTGLVYVPTIDAVYPFYPAREFRYLPNAMNTGEDYPALAEGIEGVLSALRFCSPTHLTAWDPVARRAAWRVSYDHALPAGVLATAGDLVFHGGGDGVLRAYRAADGEALWESRAGVAIVAAPVSYEVNGEQYVAVLAGLGGSFGLHNTVIDYVNDGRVLAWKLGGAAPMPRVEPRPAPRVDAPPGDAPAQTISRGRDLYATHCLRCHGANARSSGVLPDLRHSTRAVHEQWLDIVLGGTYLDRGMASFADLLDRDEAEAIHAYVIERATRTPGWRERAIDAALSAVCLPASWAAD